MKKINKIIITLFLLITFFKFSYCKESIKLKSLDFYISYALKNNLNIKQKQLDIILSKKNIWAAYYKFDPQYSFSFSDNLSDREKDLKKLSIGLKKKLTDGKSLNFSISNGYINEDRLYTLSTSLGITIPLLKYNSIYLNTLNIKEKEILYKKELLNLFKVKQDIIFKVINSYINLLKSIKTLNINKLAKQDAKKFLEITSEKKKEGLIAKPEYQRAKLRYKQTQAEYLNALQKVKDNYLNLLIITGFSYKKAFNYLKNFTFQNLNLDIIDYKINNFVNNFFDKNYKLTYFRNLALKYNPDIKNFYYEFKLNKISKIYAKENLKNDLNLSLSLNYNNTDKAFITSEGRVSANINLNYSFDPFGRKDELYLLSNKIEKEKLENLYKLKKKDLLTTININYNNLLSKKQQLKILENSIKISKDNLNLINESYKEGIKSYLNVLDAQKEFTRVQILYVNYYYDIFTNIIKLYSLIGKDLNLIINNLSK